MRLTSKLWRFALAGAAGFIVDTAVLYALRGVIGPYAGRLVSFFCAVLTTWMLNRTFAFATHEKHLPLWREFSHYFLAMLGGGSINYAVYSVLITFVPLIYHNPIIGVACGSIAGLSVNFFLAHSVVFRRKPTA
jgi:putative flippase GtrA